MKIQKAFILLLSQSWFVAIYSQTTLENNNDSVAWLKVPELLKTITEPVFPKKVFNIIDYGASADSGILCTDAINKAITACHKAGGGRVEVPNGVFLTGAIHLLSNVNLHLDDSAVLRFSRNTKDYLPLVHTRFESVECMNYSPFIYAYKQKNIAITGTGTLDGGADTINWWLWKGGRKWDKMSLRKTQYKAIKVLDSMANSKVPVKDRTFGDGYYLRPLFIQPNRCKNVLIEGVTIINSPFWEINPVLCKNVIVRKVKISSHGPNNDGCDPESCHNVLIQDCTFDTGDDCIAIKSGRNADGRRINIASENIIIQRCNFKDGHGGVVIGSEVSGNCRNVFAEDCSMDSPNLDRVLRIKSNSVRGGIIENVYLRNIRTGVVADAIFLIDLHYENGDSGVFLPQVRNIYMRQVTSKASRYGLYIRGYEKSLVKDIFITNCTFENVKKGNVLEWVQNLNTSNLMINGQKIEYKSYNTKKNE